jgi:hypothetical protein
MARIPQKWVPVLRKECARLCCPDLERIDPKNEVEIPTFKTWSGLSSNDGSGFV